MENAPMSGYRFAFVLLAALVATNVVDGHIQTHRLRQEQTTTFTAPWKDELVRLGIREESLTNEGSPNLAHELRGFIPYRRTDPFSTVTLEFGIQRPDPEGMKAFVLDVSTPSSPNYGKHLTPEEFAERFANKSAAFHVRSWLEKNLWLIQNSDDEFQHSACAITIDPSRVHTHIKVTTCFAVASQLLQAQFIDFHDKYNPHLGSVSRCSQFKLPNHIADVLFIVIGTTDYPARPVPRVPARPHTKDNGTDRSDGAFYGGTVTPSELWSYYGVDDNVISNPRQAGQAIYCGSNQNFSPDDLSSFQSTFGLYRRTVDNVVGENDPSACPNACNEANLDVQCMSGVAQKAYVSFLKPSSNSASSMISFLWMIGNQSTPASVASISYSYLEEYTPSETLDGFDNEAAALGGQGVSVFVASGDDGAYGFQLRQNANDCSKFAPYFPASSPHITSVGASMGPENQSPETSCVSSFNGVVTSGGGFSNHFSQPSWQSSAVSKYLTTDNLPPSSYYTATNRGYPDISLLGHNYEIYNGGAIQEPSGTSASSPSLAALVSLINDKRVSYGKSRLGFLNPALYSGSFMRDLTGQPSNCAADSGYGPNCCTYGWPTNSGWDAVTGLGSPYFSKMLHALV